MGWLQKLKTLVANEIIDLGVPKDAVRPEDMRRIRIISITTIGLCSVIGVPAYLQFLQFEMPVMTSLIIFTMIAAIGNLLLLRSNRNPHLAAHLAVGILASILLASSMMTGGFYNPSFSWLYVLPLAAAAAIDMRAMTVWTGIVLALAVVFWLLPDFGIVLVNQVPEEAREGNGLFTRVTTILAITVIASSFVTGQRRAEVELATANHDLVAETAYVHLLMHGAMASNEASSFENALRDSMRRICETMDWTAGHVYVVSEDGTISTSAMSHTRSKNLRRLQEVASKRTFRTGQGIVGRAVEERRPQILEALAPDDDPSSPASIAHQSGIRSAMAVPVFVGTDIPAVMLFAATSTLHNTQRLCEVFTLIGLQLGKVAERTALQERVQQSQKMEAVGQLAAGVAHEINNPMSYVRSNLNTLREEWGELRSKLAAQDSEGGSEERFDDFQDLIEESLEGVERTIAIVKDVKEFSHTGVVDRGQWETVRISDLLDGALRVVAGKAPSGVRIESHHEGAALCRCSPNQIRQVLVNLLVNAIQAVGKSGHIHLSTGLEGNEVFARVEDDGHGMSEATKERLFDPFFTTKPVGEGTGLGLSVSYEIVRNHGGEIRVSAEPGSGACFEMGLPVDTDA
jgi:signal transduction histidine kinase